MTFRALEVHVSPRVAAITVLATLVSAPTITVLQTGQFSPMLAVVMTWAWIQGRSARWGRAAVALGLIASLKPFIGLFLLYLLAIRRWRAALAFTAAATIPFAAGIGVLGLEAARSYLSTLGSSAGVATC
jgi:alpha-1,2-mannosyltransferase